MKPLLLYEVGDPVGDHPGFAAAGTREDQQGACGMANGHALFGIKIL